MESYRVAAEIKELLTDFDVILPSTYGELEDRMLTLLDKHLEDAFDDGVEYAERNHANDWNDGYNEGRSDGYDRGYDDAQYYYQNNN